MKKFILLLVLLLNGCAAWVTDDGKRVDYSSPNERRTESAIDIDSDIITDINEELSQRSELVSQSHLVINAYNGVVLITGETPTIKFRKQLIDIVRKISHVRRVHDNLTIAYPSSADVRASDKRITEQVKSALKQIRSLPHFDASVVRVITSNSTVYLMGLVHRNEGNTVVNVTRMQEGVKQIVTIFDYID